MQTRYFQVENCNESWFEKLANLMFQYYTLFVAIPRSLKTFGVPQKIDQNNYYSRCGSFLF